MTLPYPTLPAHLRPIAACAAAVAVLAACGGAGRLASNASRNPVSPRPTPMAALDGAAAQRPVDLPPASSAPLPEPPDAAAGPPLRPHELVGFAPYWTLDIEAGYQYADLTTVAYFGLDVAADGSVVESGPGWEGYISQALVDLIDRAHRAGDGAVLTAKCFDQPTLDAMLHDPSAAPRLGDALVAAVRAKRMDGVNLDLEGAGGADRDALAAFVATVAQRVHAADAHWQVTVDTYPDSASDPSGWFDVARLAAVSDALFVMAYGMQDASRPSPAAPLQGPGETDLSVVDAYLGAVPADRLLLGVPFYGLDWPASGPQEGAAATGSPSVVGEGDIAAAGRPRYWDATAFTPWTSYQDPAGAWHQVYWDDADSLAYKARLAGSGHLRGVGVWALGMDGNSRAMTLALLGRSRPVKEQLGPSATPAPAPIAPPPAPPPATAPPRTSPRPSPTPSPSPRPSPTPAPLISPPPLP